MKLTENHIDNLYKFTKQHYVEYYDVQTELVDHLANDIEQIWEEDPKLSFEKARDKSFKKFGIFGFMDVIEAKQKQMNKRYWKIILRFAKEWFTVPKIIITFSVFVLFTMVLQIKLSKEFFLIVIQVAILFDITRAIFRRRKKKQKKLKKEKKFLLETLIGQCNNKGNISSTFMGMYFIFTLVGKDFSSLSIYWIILIAAILTLISILLYVSGTVLPQKAEQLLQETYPEYKLS